MGRVEQRWRSAAGRTTAGVCAVWGCCLCGRVRSAVPLGVVYDLAFDLCCCSCACVQEWAWRRLFGCEAVRKRVLADGKHRKQNAHTDDVLCSVQISSGLCLCPDLSPEPSPNPSPPLLCLSPPPSRSPSPFLPLASPTRSGSKTTTPRARDCDTTRRSFASPAAEQAGAVDKGSWGLADGPATRAAPAAAGMQAERQRHL